MAEKSPYTDKELYIKHVAALILAYADFDRESMTVLIRRAIQGATLLADSFLWIDTSDKV